MDYEKRTPRHDWRSKLTAEEAQRVAAIEAEVQEYGSKKTELLAELSPIRNRAIQRCRYEEQAA